MTKDRLNRGIKLVTEISHCEQCLNFLKINDQLNDGQGISIDAGDNLYALPPSVIPLIISAYEKSLAAYKKEFDEL